MNSVSYMKIVCASLLFLLAWNATAQTTSSELSGTVVDPAGAVVPGARITVSNEGTSETRTTTTNDSGGFAFPAMVRGTYSIKVEANGFKTREQKGIVITANEKRNVGDIALQLGNASESITVDAQAAQVQSSSAENSSMLSDRQLETVSTRGRDVISLLKLIPGVTPGNDAESLGGTFGTTLPAVNGLSSGFNQVTLDGQSGTDDDITNAFNETTSMDAIAEVKVLMNNYQAEYGRNASAVINLISKSGTQQFHGSAYWYKRHEQFNANDFFNNRNSAPKPRYRYNIFGGTIGGPIYIPHAFNTAKNKLFFFYSREDQRTYTPAALQSVTMPTQLERSGDFSQTLDVSGKLVPITDPTTRQAVPGNQIAPSKINKYGQAMLNIFKQPNFFNRAISGGNYNYQWQQTAEVPKKQNLLKVDFNPNAKDRISIRPRSWWADTRQYNIFGNFQTNWDFYKQHYLFTDKSIETNYTRIISSTLINELSVSFRALRETDPLLSPTQWDPILRSKQGLSGLGQWFPENNPSGIIPAMSFGGVPSAANVNGEVLNRIPIDARDYRYTVLDNLSKTHGQHQFKIGYYYEFNVGSEGSRGNFYGNFAFDKDTNSPIDTNYAYSNAIFGSFQRYTESNKRNTAKNFFSLTEFFAQDSWKVTRRVTLELGMRFSYAPPLRFPDGDAAAFYLSLYNPAKTPLLIRPAIDPSTGKRAGFDPVANVYTPVPTIGFYAPNSGDPLNGLRKASEPGYDHFADGSGGVRLSPRFGFAWDVFGTGKTALRGGGSITRNPLISNSQLSSPGVSTPPAQYNPALYYGTLDNFTTATGLLSPPRVTTYGPEMKVPTVYNYSLSIQQDLGHAFLASIGYVGNRGLHLLQNQNINLLPYGTRFLPSNIDPTNGLPLPDNFLRPFPGFDNLSHLEDNGISNYNALQTTLQRRFSKGFQLSSSYTWSKAMSDGNVRPTYLTRSWYYGKTADDRTHVLVLNFTYDVPKLSKVVPNPIVKGVFDGWELSGIGTFASGAPQGFSFTTVSGADLTGGGDLQRVVMVAPPTVSQKTFAQWFNTASVALPAKGTAGNAAPDEFRGPGTNNWDLTVFKNFKYKEKATFQLRWEAYNVFNHTQWSTVNSAARFDNSGAQVNALFGTVTGSRSPRVMQGSLRIQF